MRALAAGASGRRTRWIFIGVWVVLTAVFFPLSSKLPDEVTERQAGFIPKSSQSREVADLLDKRFPGGDTAPALLVYKRAGGLTAADRRTILADARKAAGVPLIRQPLVPFGPDAVKGLVSERGDVAFVATPIAQAEQAEQEKSLAKLAELQEDGATPGLTHHVTGGAALEIDQTRELKRSDMTLLVVTGSLVLFLLIAIYRAPLIALVPLVVVGVAYTVAAGILYILAKQGMQVTGSSRSLVLVLMFGAGTDYCLLLVARYVEDLRLTDDKHEAMRKALPRAAPAILASGITVMLAVLALLVATVSSTSTLGPVNAIGVGVMLLASVTLLPALLAVVGRGGFFPSGNLVRYSPELPAAPQLLPGLAPLNLSRLPVTDQHPSVRQREGIWRRLGARVLERPIPALLGVMALLAIGMAGLTVYQASSGPLENLRSETDGTQGYEVLRSAFPEGTLAPTTVLVERKGGDVAPNDVRAVQRRLKQVPRVGQIRPVSNRSKDGQIAAFNVISPDNPYGNPALDRIPRMREAAEDAPGVRALVGGQAGIAYDYREASSADLKRVIPLVLFVVFLTLVALLRAVVAPLYLIGSVLLSFLAILGISLFFFKVGLGRDSVNPAFPTFAFIFLVALGVDYNIFLMDRVRDEAAKHGTRNGVLRALVATGPVITSAGLILAGTFASLLTVRTYILAELGFAVAVGVLLDTFLVRTIMVPAIIRLVGDRSWWPSKLAEPAHAAVEPVAPQPATQLFSQSPPS